MHVEKTLLEKHQAMRQGDRVRIYFNNVRILPLPKEPQSKIRQMAIDRASAKQIHIMNFLVDLAKHKIQHPRISFI